MTMRVLLTIAIVAGSFVLAPNPPANALANRPIYSDLSHRCVDVAPQNQNGMPVQLADCTGNDNQAWTWYSDGTIKSSFDGRCLDLDTASRGPDGAPYRVHVWDCHGGTNQQWKDGWAPGQILSAHNDRALEASPTPSNPDPTSLQVWPADRDHRTQYWSCDCRVPYSSR